MLPLKLRNIYSSLGGVRKSFQESGRIIIAGPSASGKKGVEILLGAVPGMSRLLLYTIGRKGMAKDDAERVVRDYRPDVVLVLFPSDGADIAPTVEFIQVLRRKSVRWIPVITKADLDDRFIETMAEVNRSTGRDPEEIAAVSTTLGFGGEELATIIVDMLPDDRQLPVGASFILLRETVARRIIRKVAIQNGVVATLGFTPGADIAVLSANQVRMVLEIAGVYGEELTIERAQEVFATIGGGLLLRTAARQLLGFIPVAGWAVKGGIAYAGTIGMGQAAIAYFSRPQMRAKVSEGIRGIAGKTQSAVEKLRNRGA